MRISGAGTGGKRTSGQVRFKNTFATAAGHALQLATARSAHNEVRIFTILRGCKRVVVNECRSLLISDALFLKTLQANFDFVLRKQTFYPVGYY